MVGTCCIPQREGSNRGVLTYPSPRRVLPALSTLVLNFVWGTDAAQYSGQCRSVIALGWARGHVHNDAAQYSGQCGTRSSW